MKISNNLRRFGELMGRTLELEKEFFVGCYKDSRKLSEIKNRVFELGMDILEWRAPTHCLPMYNLLLDISSKLFYSEIDEETVRRVTA